MLVALAFTAVVAEPEAEAYYSRYYGYPGFYNNFMPGYGYSGFSGYYGFPSRSYFYNNWNRMNNFRNFYKREAVTEAEPTAVAAPEAESQIGFGMNGYYGYNNGFPSQFSGMQQQYGMPSGNFYGNRFWKRDAEAVAEAEAAAQYYNRYYETYRYLQNFRPTGMGGYRMNNYYGMRPIPNSFYGSFMY